MGYHNGRKKRVGHNKFTKWGLAWHPNLSFFFLIEHAVETKQNKTTTNKIVAGSLYLCWHQTSGWKTTKAIVLHWCVKNKSDDVNWGMFRCMCLVIFLILVGLLRWPCKQHHRCSLIMSGAFLLLVFWTWCQLCCGIRISRLLEAGHQIEVDADAYLLFPNESEQTWPTICPDVLITWNHHNENGSKQLELSLSQKQDV